MLTTFFILKNLKFSFYLSKNLCDIILSRCRGIDPIPLDDDGGCESKTVSVEDSFVRGSILDDIVAKDKLDSLCGRLVHLLKERKINASDPELAYPETLRLTIRFVDRSVEKGRRPFRTISKQITISYGKKLVGDDSSCGDNDISARNILSQVLNPMLDILLHKSKQDINLTRMNIAATNFVDITSRETSNGANSKQHKVSDFFRYPDTDVNKSMKDKFCFQPSSSTHVEQSNSTEKCHSGTLPKKRKTYEADPGAIDPNILAELPPQIAREVRSNMFLHQGAYNVDSSLHCTRPSTNSKKKCGLFKYFSKRS